MLQFTVSDEQQQLLEAFQRVTREEFPASRLISRVSSPLNQDVTKWPVISQLGWFELLLPDSGTGQAYSSVDQCLIHREFGRCLLTPVVLGSMLGAALAMRADARAEAQAIVAGRAKVAPAIACERSGGRPARGNHYYVVGLGDCDSVIIWNDAGAGLYPVAQFADITVAQPVEESLTLHRVTLQGAEPSIWLASPALSQQATLLISAQLVGAAQAALDLAVAYAKTREQFGQQIGAFQAIKHKCSDMLARVEVAWGQIMMAALSQGADGADAFHVSAAKVLATDAALRNAAANIQVHGGMGFTAECAAQLYLKRAHTLDLMGGPGRENHLRILASESPV